MDTQTCGNCGNAADLLHHSAVFYKDHAGQLAYSASESVLSYRCDACGNEFHVTGNGLPTERIAGHRLAHFAGHF